MVSVVCSKTAQTVAAHCMAMKACWNCACDAKSSDGLISIQKLCTCKRWKFGARSTARKSTLNNCSPFAVDLIDFCFNFIPLFTLIARVVEMKTIHTISPIFPWIWLKREVTTLTIGTGAKNEWTICFCFGENIAESYAIDARIKHNTYWNSNKKFVGAREQTTEIHMCVVYIKNLPHVLQLIGNYLRF